MSQSASETRGWQSIGRALNVLEVIGSHKRPVSMTEIAEEVRLTMSTTHRIMRGLEARGFILRDPLSGEYSVGPSIMRLARSALQQAADGDLVLATLPRMQRLRELTGETVGFHVVNGNRRLCLVELPSHQPIRMASGVGATYSLGIGASGKALLAYLPEETLEKVIATSDFQNQSTIGTAIAPVRRALARVRRAGYAMSVGETVQSAAAIAVPILDTRGLPRGAINITGPDSRWTKAKMLEHLDALHEVKTWLELTLGREEGVFVDGDQERLTD
ncbi:MAG TPA: IclR family transcriptional regulator [Jatrophihabitans sp.]|jgi:DNA-binding IclR family transcriptional regulator|nr:IclR family transcriptional regulator [Jatrophihabitans sp.]